MVEDPRDGSERLVEGYGNDTVAASVEDESLDAARKSACATGGSYNVFMRFAALCRLLRCLSPLKTWDAKMPDAVPAVTGRVVEAATFRYIDVKIGEGALAQPAEQYTVHYTRTEARATARSSIPPSARSRSNSCKAAAR